MGKVTNRISLTSRGWISFGAWPQEVYTYSLLQINLGNNPNSRLEIVSSLNMLEIGRATYYYDYRYCTEKYNPKVYFGTIQSFVPDWNLDYQNSEKWASNGTEKSGSWPNFYLKK